MTVTREENFPEEIAQLFQAFSHCADGHPSFNVLEASANLLIAAIGFHARSNGMDLAGAMSLAAAIGEAMPGNVAAQWGREPKASDVVVAHGN